MLGTLAHELRSPLVTIVDAAQVITNGCDMEPADRRALAVIERQSRQALHIIVDLFDICAGTGGKLPVRREMVELANIVTAATETTGHLLAARQHCLTVSLPPGPVCLEGDLLWLTQVQTNLLGNAACLGADGELLPDIRGQPVLLLDHGKAGSPARSRIARAAAR